MCNVNMKSNREKQNIQGRAMRMAEAGWTTAVVLLTDPACRGSRVLRHCSLRLLRVSTIMRNEVCMLPVSMKRLFLGCLVPLLFLSGCGSQSYQPVVTLEDELRAGAAPLPKYRVGDKFVYSNGTWEKVAYIEDDQVTWINHRGYYSSGKSDFTYRRSSWESSKRFGVRTFKQAKYLLDQSTTSLWPLAVGKPNRFIEYGKWYVKGGSGRGYDVFWRCMVTGKTSLNVAAGEFDSWVIQCEKYSSFYRYPSTRSSEDKTWYFAPSVGHWVREEKDYNGSRPNREKELVAVVPDLKLFAKSSEESAQIRKLFQNTLEYNRGGEAGSWGSLDAGRFVTMMPTKSLRHDSGAVCRQYSLQLQDGLTISNYYGIACRDREGSWRIPRR